MKLLLVSDLHYSLKQWDWLSAAASRFDATVIAGDLLDIGSALDLEVQILVTLKYLRKIAASSTLIVASGNHDLDAHNELGELQATWLTKANEWECTIDGQSIMLGNDMLVTVCPWWNGPKTRDHVYSQFRSDSQVAHEHWLWIYHSPPVSSPLSWTGRRDVGDRDLRDWIREFQPAMVLAGHVHQAPFTEQGSWIDQLGSTWIFNPGKQPGSTPTHIIIDTDEQVACWNSMEGSVEASLRGG